MCSRFSSSHIKTSRHAINVFSVFANLEDRLNEAYRLRKRHIIQPFVGCRVTLPDDPIRYNKYCLNYHALSYVI
jgi:hypothetical protein